MQFQVFISVKSWPSKDSGMLGVEALDFNLNILETDRWEGSEMEASLVYRVSCRSNRTT